MPRAYVRMCVMPCAYVRISGVVVSLCEDVVYEHVVYEHVVYEHVVCQHVACQHVVCHD